MEVWDIEFCEFKCTSMKSKAKALISCPEECTKKTRWPMAEVGCFLALRSLMEGRETAEEVEEQPVGAREARTKEVT